MIFKVGEALVCTPSGSAYDRAMRVDALSSHYHGPILRVGSHVVSVRIHCTEKWLTSFHTDVLSKSK